VIKSKVVRESTKKENDRQESYNRKGDRKGGEAEGKGEYFKDKKGNRHKKIERGNGNKREGKT
jgi:hypothetical protein